MNNSLKAINLNRIVESTFQSNILNDAEIELGDGYARVRIANLLRLLLRAYRGDDGVAVFQEDVEDMGGDEAAASCNFELLDFRFWGF